MNVIFRKALCVAASLALGACSVAMSLDGEKTPDLSVLKEGALKGEVEMHLGHPVKTETLSNGNTRCYYTYNVGKEGSAGRAIGHGALDIATLGLWEIAGTPIEACAGDSYQIMVEYNANQRIVNMMRSGKNQKFV